MTRSASVWLVLKPSEIEGVGVFTEKPILAGETVNLFYPRDWRFIRNPTGRDKALCNRYAVQHKVGYSCPKTFLRMSLGWYLNHSKKPNVIIDRHGRCKSTRHINTGEEITIDYSLLDPAVDNSP